MHHATFPDHSPLATRSPGSHRRAGFSLVELLVVVAIIGILVALTLPAVGYIRESARCVECKNRLHQFGLAIHQHNEQYGTLPLDGFNGYGYGAFLLTFLDQAPLATRIDPTKNRLPDPTKARPEFEDVVLPVFRCPSFSGTERLKTSEFGRSNYLGTDEMFSERISFHEVHDGESQTIAIGETATDQGWALPGTGSCTSPPNKGGRFGSMHSGGAHFVMCDSAVRFIKSSVDPATFQALGTRKADDVIEGDW